jgi:DNA polymerase
MKPGTDQTTVDSARSKKTSPTLVITYDIQNSGPRSRYVIRTRSGPLLVHNCGYGLGATKFVSYSEKAGTEITESFAKTAVRTYRNERYKVVRFWSDVERCAITAVREKRTEKNFVRLRNLKFYCEDRWFCIELPSGRKLRYYRPQVKVVEKFGEPSLQLSYKVEFRGRLVSEATYGGKLVENVVQAIARDFMVNGMFKAEKAGYPVVGTVHDELITEPKIGFGSVKELEDVVCELPPWGAGCPIAAKGFESPRYRKD